VLLNLAQHKTVKSTVKIGIRHPAKGEMMPGINFSGPGPAVNCNAINFRCSHSIRPLHKIIFPQLQLTTLEQGLSQVFSPGQNYIAAYFTAQPAGML
jgi:hypothetical protein